MENKPKEDMLLTVKEVSTILKTNTDYVYRLRESGLLRFLKIGQYKVRKTTLEEFLKEYDGKDISDPFNVKDL